MIDGNLGDTGCFPAGRSDPTGAVMVTRPFEAARQTRQFLRFLCRTRYAVVAAVVLHKHGIGSRGKASTRHRKDAGRKGIPPIFFPLT